MPRPFPWWGQTHDKGPLGIYAKPSSLRSLSLTERVQDKDDVVLPQKSLALGCP